MTPHSITDDLAEACAPFMAISGVDIQVEATYRYDRLGGRPLAGMIECHANVQGRLFSAAPLDIEIETAHPSMHDQRVRWRMVAAGSDSVDFVSLAPC